jgi:predicted ATPase/Tfp pilus assembly protein PilF
VEPEAETTALCDQISAGTLPAPRSPALTNWPRPSTSFVGRDTELHQLSDALGSREVRLVSLVGPGGIGKTRLALEAAARAAFAFQDGVTFVPLAAVTDPAYIIPAFADALGLTLAGKGDTRAQLLSHLASQERLLVLDNLEHLMPLGDLVVDLLRECPSLTLLITSRERLNLVEEWVLMLEGLEIPDEIVGGRLEDFSAVGLFVQRARQNSLSYRLPESEYACLRDICSMVGGMPLAIEMAAGWSAMMSCEEIAAQIEHNMNILSVTLRNVPERQRSMRATFEYSWTLLSDVEQHVFRQMAAFSGGFLLDAALAVIELPQDQALDPVLMALVSKSLLQIDSAGRYDQHPLVHQYAAEKLAETPDLEEATQARHSRFYADVLDKRHGAFVGAGQLQATREIIDEIDNVRRAWDQAVAEIQPVEIRRMAQTMRMVYYQSGWFREGLALSANAAAAFENEVLDGEGRIASGAVLANQAFFSLLLGDLDEATVLVEHSDAVLRPEGATRELGYALSLRGGLYWRVGDYDQAEQCYKEFRATSEAIGSRTGIANATQSLGNIATARGDYATARSLYEQAIPIQEEEGNLVGLGIALNNLAATLLRLKDATAAIPVLERCLELYRGVNDIPGSNYVLGNLGRAKAMLGQFEEAEAYFREALEEAQRINHGRLIVENTYGLGEIALQRGDLAAADTLLHDALRLAVEQNLPPYIVAALAILAYAGFKQGTLSAEAAAERLAFAIAHAALEDNEREQSQEFLREIGEHLPAEVLAAVQARGAARTLDEVVAEVQLLRSSLAQ